MPGNRYKRSFVALAVIVMMAALTACGTPSPTESTEPLEETSMEPLPPINAADSDTESEAEMTVLDFSAFTNVEITGLDLSTLKEEERSVLYQQARYCQAMTDADTETMAEIVPADRVFTHMSGRQQTREEYFADIENGSLQYFTIGMENPVVAVHGNYASVTFTSVLNANAYGARGTYRMGGTHWYQKQDGRWMASNALQGAPQG